MLRGVGGLRRRMTLRFSALRRFVIVTKWTQFESGSLGGALSNFGRSGWRRRAVRRRQMGAAVPRLDREHAAESARNRRDPRCVGDRVPHLQPAGTGVRLVVAGRGAPDRAGPPGVALRGKVN